MNDPERDRCIQESIQKLLPTLREKTPNFDFPIIDPHQPGPLTFKFKNRYVAGGTSNLTNVRTFGISRGKVRSVKSTFKDDRMKLNIEIFFPKLFSTGNYSSLFALNSLLTFRSKGIYKITLTDLNEKWTIKGKLERRAGEDYMKAYRIDVDPEANDIDIHFTGLTQDERLGMHKDICRESASRKLFQILAFRRDCSPIFQDLLARFLQGASARNACFLGANILGHREQSLVANSFSSITYSRLSKTRRDFNIEYSNIFIIARYPST